MKTLNEKLGYQVYAATGIDKGRRKLFAVGSEREVRADVNSFGRMFDSVEVCLADDLPTARLRNAARRLTKVLAAPTHMIVCRATGLGEFMLAAYASEQRAVEIAYKIRDTRQVPAGHFILAVAYDANMRRAGTAMLNRLVGPAKQEVMANGND